MRELADLYDINIPVLENEPYVRRVRELREQWEDQLRRKNLARRDTHSGPGEINSG